MKKIQKKNPKGKRADAERACEWYAHEVMNCLRTVRSVKTQWQRQDMFSCDVLGKRVDGSLVALQVTAGQPQAVTARKRKIEKELWHRSDVIQLLQLVREDRKWFFRVYEYYNNPSGSWIWLPLTPNVPVPKSWFRKWKPK